MNMVGIPHGKALCTETFDVPFHIGTDGIEEGNDTVTVFIEKIQERFGILFDRCGKVVHA